MYSGNTKYFFFNVPEFVSSFLATTHTHGHTHSAGKVIVHSIMPRSPSPPGALDEDALQVKPAIRGFGGAFSRTRVHACVRVCVCVREPQNCLILMRALSPAASTHSMHSQKTHCTPPGRLPLPRRQYNHLIGTTIFAIGSAVGGIKRTNDRSKRACDMLHISFQFR